MSNKRFGYARVSTTDQNEDRQVLELLESGIEERDIYVDKAFPLLCDDEGKTIEHFLWDNAQ